jgi:hypothetical protein
MPHFYRDVDVYVDLAGRSEVRETLAKIGKSDERAARTINSRIRVMRQQTLADALRTGLIKQPTPNIYVLRVQSGPVSYRLPFFEAPEHNGKLAILTHCEHRSVLRGDRYKALIEAAERRREDWIRRNCQGGG